MTKYLKYGLLFIAIAFLAYHSVYVKKLSEVKAGQNTQFDAISFVNKLWKEQLPTKLDSSVDLTFLKNTLQKSKLDFDKYTKALAIGNYGYALVKGTALVKEIREDYVSVTILSDVPFDAVLATEYVYGNALRDASGLVHLQDFPNTNDLNSISEAFNNKVRNEAIPAARPLLKPGNKIQFVGAVELNKEHFHFDDLEIIPVTIKTAT